MKIEIDKNKQGEYYWRAVASNGEILAVSEAYSSKAKCEQTVKMVNSFIIQENCLSKISDEDLAYIEDVSSLDDTEYGEYLGEILSIYNDGFINDAASDEFKTALTKELIVNIEWAKENLDIEEYTIQKEPTKYKRLKEKE